MKPSPPPAQGSPGWVSGWSITFCHWKLNEARWSQWLWWLMTFSASLPFFCINGAPEVPPAQWTLCDESHTSYHTPLLNLRKQKHKRHLLLAVWVAAPCGVSVAVNIAAPGSSWGTRHHSWCRPRLPLWTKSERSRWSHFVSFLFKENQEWNKKGF